MNLLPYKPEDYSGKFSLLSSQKTLIKSAFIKANGNLDEMTRLLNIEREALLIAIIRHFNIATASPKPKPPKKVSR